jgi:hypothetical protein
MRRRKATAATAPKHHTYSVRLSGMSLWDEHLKSFRLARLSAAEPRAMGLDSVHIIDEDTGVCLE